MKDKHINLISLIVLLSMILVLFFSQIYISSHINHKCCGSDCPICEHMHYAQVTINQISTFIRFVSLISIFLICTLHLFINYVSVCLFKTPIDMKVRLND